MDWFPYNPIEWREDTLDFTLEADGAYHRLVDHYYITRTPLPDNPVALARIIGIGINEFQAIAEQVLSKFKAKDGLLHHKRCDTELNRQDSLSKKRSNAAKKAYNKRNKNNDVQASAEQMPSNSTNTRQDKTRQDKDITTTTPISAPDENGGVGDFKETPFSAEPIPENAGKTVDELTDIPEHLLRDNEPEAEAAPELRKRPSLADQCEPDTREPKTPQDAIAVAYMEIVNKVYGSGHLLTHPGHGAPMIAKRWVEAGADLELCKSVFETVLMDQKTKGEQPPKTLKYFDNPISRAIKEASAPMPEASAGNKWGKKEPAGLHVDAEKNQWEGRIKGFREKGFWMDNWGPNPDHPDCEAPAELLDAAK